LTGGKSFLLIQLARNNWEKRLFTYYSVTLTCV